MRIFKACLLIISHWVFWFPLSSQQTTTNFIGLSFGGSNFHISDELASPVIFRGTGTTPSIRFTQNRIKCLHILEGSYLHNNLSAGADNFSAENFKGRFSYGYYHRALNGMIAGKKFETYFGPGLTSFFCMTDYFFDIGTFQGRSITTWYWSHSLDLSVLADYRISDKNLIRFQARMPVFSNVARPAYSSIDDYDLEKNDWIVKPFGKNRFFPKNCSIQTRLLIQKQVSDKIYLQLDWEFYFLKYPEPAVLKMYMNNFSLGAGLKF